MEFFNFIYITLFEKSKLLLAGKRAIASQFGRGPWRGILLG